MITLKDFFIIVQLSFYSKKLYHIVANVWQGWSLRYLLYLTVFATVPIALFWLDLINAIDPISLEQEKTISAVPSDTTQKGMNIYLEKLLHQLPPLTIKNGELWSDITQPYFVYLPNSKRVFMIIDTTGKYNNLLGNEALILFTKYHCVVRIFSSQILTYPFSTYFPSETTIIDKSWYITAISKAKSTARWFIPFVFFPTIVIISLLYKAVRSLFYAIGGILLCGILSIKLPFQTLFRLAIVSSTPTAILELLPLFIQLPSFFPLIQMMLFISSAGYFYFALYATKITENQDNI